MANFQMVEIGGQHGCYINLDLVRAILPYQNGSTIIFDDNHRLAVNIPPGILTSGLMKKVERSI